MTPKRIQLGKITGPHGIKGLVKVLYFGEDPRNLEQCGPLYTGEEGDATIALTLKNSQGKHWLASIEGVTDRNASEELRGTELWVNRDALPEPEEGEYYFADLVGLKAIGTDGKEFGKIIAVENFGGGDLLEVQPADDEAYYIPFNKKTTVKVDVQGGLITLNPPEGLR